MKRYLGGRNPLGALICQGSGPDVKPDIEIIGVVANSAIVVFARNRSRPTFRFSRATMLGGNFYVKVQGTPEVRFHRFE